MNNSLALRGIGAWGAPKLFIAVGFSQRLKLWHSILAFAAKTNIMSDDKTKKDFHDRDRISLSEEHEVRYWTERFGVDRNQLEKLVREVGPMVKDVEAILKHKI